MNLRRSLGTRDLTFFAIACIIGTRWIATAAHAGPGSILLWIAGALCFSIPLAIAVAALTVRQPGAGGMYAWTRRDFGPLSGFLCFWLYWLGIVFWFPGAAMFYVSATGLPFLNDRFVLVAVALAAIWIGLAANIFGVESGQRIADVGAACAWGFAIALGAGAFVFLRHHPSVTSFHLLPDFSWDTVAFWSAIAYAMSGMESVALMSAEVHDPERSMPRAAWISALVSVLFYAGATAAVLVILRPEQISELQGLAQAAQAIASAFHAAWMAPLLAVLVIGSVIGQFGTLGSSVSRMPLAAGVDGLLPRMFSVIHPRWNTPHVSILTLGIVASVLLVLVQLGDTARAAYDTLVSLMVVVGFLPFIWIFASAWKAGHPFAAAIGGGVTVIAILAGVIPSGGITHVWIFELKLTIGTAASIGSGWLIYAGSQRRNAAAISSKVIAPG